MFKGKNLHIIINTAESKLTLRKQAKYVYILNVRPLNIHSCVWILKKN